MAVNKVVFGAVSVIDISDSTVTADTLAKGATAYDKSGEKIVGTMESGSAEVANINIKNVSLSTDEILISSTGHSAIPANDSIAFEDIVNGMFGFILGETKLTGYTGCELIYSYNWRNKKFVYFRITEPYVEIEMDADLL